MKTAQEMINEICGEKVINCQEVYGHLFVDENAEAMIQSVRDMGYCADDMEPVLLSEYLAVGSFTSDFFWQKAVRNWLPDHAEDIISAWMAED
jgi:hypothetical protein